MLKNKKLILLALLVVGAIALSACAPSKPAETAAPAPVVTDAPKTETEAPKTETEAPKAEETKEEPAQEEAMMELTLEELAKFNGKDGAKAYVAVDGVIYDVTDVAAWKDGLHNGGKLEAGNDVSDAIRQAPHGLANLEKLTKVGTLKK